MKKALLYGCGGLIVLSVILPLIVGGLVRLFHENESAAAATSIANAAASGAAPAKSAPVASAPPASAIAAMNFWHISKNDSSFEQNQSTEMIVEGAAFTSWPGTDHAPALHVGCKGKELVVYFNSDTQLQPERDDKITLLLRFDDEKSGKVRGRKSTDGEAVFFPNAKGMVDQIRKHKVLTIGFTPFQTAAQETLFPIIGFEDRAASLRAVCLPSVGK